MKRRGVLFVSHDASRAGAQIALLHFLRWFKKNGNRRFSILLDHGGELIPEFEDIADTWPLNRSRWRPESLRAGLCSAAGLPALARHAESRDARRFAARCDPCLVYANSVASARAVDVLTPQTPILTHVHELQSGFRTLSGPSLSRLLDRTSTFIACSEAARTNLVRGQHAEAARIETVYESIPVRQTQSERSRAAILGELRLPEQSLLVVGCGTPSWRKGASIFVQVARLVCDERSDARFLWVGGGWPEQLARCEQDARLAGLSEKTRFIGAVAHPAEYLAAADVFLLTSREDPFPLVALEAAASGKPIVCFADAGGMPEFVEEDCGFVVRYLDIEAMAERVLQLLDSPDCRRKIGEAARRKVMERHDISIAAPRIADIIERTIARG